MTGEAPEGAAIPNRIEKRLSALRNGVLQDGALTQGEIRDIATELLSTLAPETPSQGQTDE